MKYNQLDLLNERRLHFIPPHFAKNKVSEIDVYGSGEAMVSWIRAKLQGRFSVVKTPVISSNDKLKSEFFVAFEDHKELTYFILACPHIRRN